MSFDDSNNYVQSFGFGDRSLILLPGETRGLVRPLADMAPIDVACCTDEGAEGGPCDVGRHRGTP